MTKKHLDWNCFLKALPFALITEILVIAISFSIDVDNGMANMMTFIVGTGISVFIEITTYQHFKTKIVKDYHPRSDGEK